MSMNPSNEYSDVYAVVGCLFTTKIIEIVFIYTNQQLKIKVEKKHRTKAKQSKANKTKKNRRREDAHSHTQVCCHSI